MQLQGPVMWANFPKGGAALAKGIGIPVSEAALVGSLYISGRTCKSTTTDARSWILDGIEELLIVS